LVFPAGGTLDGHIVRYALISQQPTTLGELNGGVTRSRDARGFPLGEDAANAKDSAADNGVSCPRRERPPVRLNGVEGPGQSDF
jgi:hypothetical protein